MLLLVLSIIITSIAIIVAASVAVATRSPGSYSFQPLPGSRAEVGPWFLRTGNTCLEFRASWLLFSHDFTLRSRYAFRLARGHFPSAPFARCARSGLEIHNALSQFCRFGKRKQGQCLFIICK